MSTSSWCLIESDPGVFTQLIKEIGVEGVAVRELYGLDPESFANFANEPAPVRIFGFIFLFNISKDKEQKNVRQAVDNSTIYFAKQTVENACASQAIVSILLNKRNDLPNLGENLKDLYEFTKEFRDPNMRGEAIGNCDSIRVAHNAFKAESSFDIQNDEEEKSKDAFHYVSYIFADGGVYELDGLQAGPICVGKCEESEWTEIVRKEVQRRIEELQVNETELRFSLMAVTGDPLDAIKENQEKNRALIAAADGEAKAEAQARLKVLDEQLEEELNSRALWKKENARRRHDFVPFILSCLRHLARRGELVDAVKKAKEVEAAREHDKKSVSE